MQALSMEFNVITLSPDGPSAGGRGGRWGVGVTAQKQVLTRLKSIKKYLRIQLSLRLGSVFSLTSVM